MEARTLLAQLDEKSLQPVYLLHGAETRLVADCIARLKELVLTGPMADYNYRRVKARDVGALTVTTWCQEVPMMGAGQLIVVDDAAAWKGADLDALLAYLDHPADTTTLVLVADKFDGKTKLAKKAAAAGWLVTADPLRDKDVVGFIRSTCARMGAAIDDGAAAALGAALGSDAVALSDALERLFLYTGGARIEERHVAQVVTPVSHNSVFELVDALGARKSADALRIAERLLADREEPIRLNFMVLRHYRNLLAVRLAGGSDAAALARRLGVPGFVVGKLRRQAAAFSPAQLQAGITRLAQADVELKSSRRPSRLVFEQALLSLCG